MTHRADAPGAAEAAQPICAADHIVADTGVDDVKHSGTDDRRPLRRVAARQDFQRRRYGRRPRRLWRASAGFSATCFVDICGRTFVTRAASISSSYAARGRCRTGGFGCGSSAACVDAATRPHSSTSACTAIATAAANKLSSFSAASNGKLAALNGAREWSARAHDTGALVKQHDTGAVGFAQRVRALLRAEAAARSGRRR